MSAGVRVGGEGVAATTIGGESCGSIVRASSDGNVRGDVGSATPGSRVAWGNGSVWWVWRRDGVAIASARGSWGAILADGACVCKGGARWG